MNRKLKWLLMVSLAAVGVLWLIGDWSKAADDEGAAEADRVAELEARIDALEDELATLKQQLQRIGGGQVEVLNYEPVLTAPLTAGGTPSRMQREPAGEINGVPYYVIPLRADGRYR